VLALETSTSMRLHGGIVAGMTAIVWTHTANRLDAHSPGQGGAFASVVNENGRWFVVWWVRPRSRTLVPSEGKGRAWIERFAGKRVEALGRLASTPGTGPSGRGGGYVQPTAEEQARYDAFTASYVPPRRSRKRSR
jgi:hypothetical protein